MKVVHRGKAVFSAATGNEIRPRRISRAALLVFYGLYGWYMAHVLGRLGIRMGLGMVLNSTMVFAVVIGGIWLLEWMLRIRFAKRPMPDWLIWIFYYEVKRPN